MRTRSLSNLIVESSTTPKRHNRGRSKQRVEPFSLEETFVVTMADQRTMAELLQAPTEGYGDAIVIPAILAEMVLALEKAKSNQAIEIASLKKRVDKLEKRIHLRTTWLKRFKKLGTARRVKSSNAGLGAQEDASKQGRSIEDIDADAEVFVDVTTSEKGEQSTKLDDSTVGEAVTTASVEDSVAPTTIEEITLAQTLIQIKAAKPKVVTTAATTTTTTRPKAKGVVVQEPSEFRVPQEAQPSISKDKGKGIMIEPEVPLKRKDQIALDEQIARDIQAKLDAELIEEENLARKQEEEANIALIESWENTQAMIEADRLLAERLQSREREELADEEKGKLFMELMEKRRKHFAALRAQEKRNRPPTKAQKRTQMSTYLKHMGKQRKEDKSEDDEGELMKHLVIKKDEDIAIDAIPLATKLPVIIDYKLHKEGMMVHYQLIRADGSSKRYSSMIRMLQGIDREDLEALWRIVKTKYSGVRPEDEFERVLWGDLKVMFEPDTTSDVWRILQGYRVTIWKLIDSSGVHFVRFDNLHIFMLVEKRYPLTPITITNMLNKKLQTDHQNEMCYQLLKLMIQKLNIKFRGGLLGLERLQGHLRLLLLSTVSMKLLLPVEVKTAQITTVSIKISTAGTYYCLCSVSAAGYKDTTVADLQLFEDLLLSRG
ncbi:hypothetical protein Tco_1457176 [Tanacetum coccineum]